MPQETFSAWDYTRLLKEPMPESRSPEAPAFRQGSSHIQVGINVPGQASCPSSTGSAESTLSSGVARMILFSRRGEPVSSVVVTRTRRVLSPFSLAHLTHACPSLE